MKDEERCEVQVANGGRDMRFHRCHYKAKGEGRDGGKKIRMCGIHLAAIEKRESKEAAYQDREKQEERRRRFVGKVGRRHGLDLELDYSFIQHRYKLDTVVVPLDQLLRLLGEEVPS